MKNNKTFPTTFYGVLAPSTEDLFVMCLIFRTV